MAIPVCSSMRGSWHVPAGSIAVRTAFAPAHSCSSGMSVNHPSVSIRPFFLSQAWGVGSVTVTILRCRACCPNISRRSPVSVPVVFTSTLAPGFGAAPAGAGAAVSDVAGAKGTIA
jgi:hypothetical protein